MFSKKPKVHAKPVKVLTGEELEAVTGGADMLTATFTYGGFGMTVVATKDAATVVTCTCKSSPKSQWWQR